MARTVYELQQRREILAEKIAANLDILAGSITTKGPAPNAGHNLTFKVDGVTRSRHIRKCDLEKVRLMTERHKTLKRLIGQMSELNWQILLLQSGRGPGGEGRP
jgi:hypothetical protein